MWMNRLLEQLGFKTSRPITLYEDNKAAILFAEHPGDHRRSKHIGTRRYFVREAVTNGEIELVYVNTEDQPPDGMTKALQPALHRKYVWKTICHTVRFHQVVIRSVCFIYHMYSCQCIRLILWLLCMSVYACKHLYILVAIYMYTIHLIVNWTLFYVLKFMFMLYQQKQRMRGRTSQSPYLRVRDTALTLSK